MGFASVPGVGDHGREEVTSTIFRGLLAELVHPDFESFVEGVVGNLLGISRGLFLSTIFVGLLLVLAEVIPNFFMFAFTWVAGTLPIWLPIAAITGAWKSWIWYIQSAFVAQKEAEAILLEVKMPRELVKSPRGMDQAFQHLWLDVGETTYFHRKWTGSVLPTFSFEIVSFGGEVHFYIWTWPEWRQAVESAIYANYPEVEIFEVEDYAMKFAYDPDKTLAFCNDFRYEPRSDAYPLKTYVDYELDTDPKEEYKVDPLALVIEHLSNCKPDEQIWLQIVIEMNKDERQKPHGGLLETEGSYVGQMEEAVDELRKKNVEIKDEKLEGWKRFSRVRSYRMEKQIESIERNMSKYPFNVGVRGVYMAAPETFGPMLHVMRWIWRPMGNPQYMNQLRPRRWHTPFDYPYQDLWDYRWHLHTRRFFDCYRRRGHFHAPYKLPHNMMSTEVLATLWHPISSAIKSPGVERILAKKAEPPPNLPR